jgi:hypothetical protein
VVEFFNLKFFGGKKYSASKNTIFSTVKPVFSTAWQKLAYPAFNMLTLSLQ